MDRGGFRFNTPYKKIPPSRDPRLANRSSRPFDPKQPPRDVSRGPENPANRWSLSTSSVPTDSQDHVSGAKFVQSIGDLTSHIISSAAAASEQEKLKKKIESTEGSLKKARAHENFPSTIASCEQRRKDEDTNMARLEEKLREHNLLRQELEKGVAAFINANASQQKDSELEDKLLRLQADVEKACRGADNAKGEAFGARNEVERLKAEKESSKQLAEKIISLQARIDMLEKSTSNNSDSWAAHSKDIKAYQERIEQLSETVAKHTDSAAANEEVFKEIQKHFGYLDTKCSKLTSDLEAVSGIRADHQHLAEQLAELKAASKQHESTAEKIHNLGEQLNVLQKSSASTEAVKNVINTINASQAKLEDISKRLFSLEEISKSSHSNDARTNQTPSELQGLKLLDTKVETLNGLESRLKKLEENTANIPSKTNPLQLDEQNSKALRSEVDNLRRQLAEMQSLQTMKDDMQFSAVEEVQEALKRNNESLEKLRSEQNDISIRLANLQESPSGEIQRQVAAFAESLENTKRIIESKQKTVEIGLHSLETRYNNLSTEPIVRHMVVAMQEIYPSPTALMEQLTSLRTQVDKCRDIPLLSARLDSIMHGQNTLADQVQKDRTSYSTELHRLRDEFTGFGQKFGALCQRYNNDIPRSGQEIQEMRGRVIALIERFNDLATRVDRDIKNREDSRQALMQEMSQERDRLNNEIKSLSAEVAEVKTAAADISKALDEKIGSAVDSEKTVNTDSLLERIRALEESTTGQLQSLVKTFEEMKESTQKEISQAISRLESLEKLKDSLVRLPLEKSIDVRAAARSRSPSALSSASVASPTIKVEPPPHSGSQSAFASGESTTSEAAGGESDKNPQQFLTAHASAEKPDKKRRRSTFAGEDEQQQQQQHVGSGNPSGTNSPAVSTSEELLRQFGAAGGSTSSKKRKKKKNRFSSGEVIQID
ncbi:hypothetical protein VTN00DRAFT_3116 [Thermoascus crustaceus]|uniref:uncharacterized protein n=1 Tax=Thermoascus crustaceus TaxID=5088 RepID=UPI003743A036